MATRSQMRTWLRRRLNETTPDQWSNSALNDYLNEGLKMIQSEIEKVDDEAFVYEDTADTITSTQIYPMPVNLKRLLKLGYKSTSSASSFTELNQITNWRKIADPDAGQSDLVYAMYGRYIYIKPSPASAVSAGLKVWYVPVLAMGADADVPDVVLDLHMAIVLAAQLIAFGDSSGATARVEVQEDLSFQLKAISTNYNRNSGGIDVFTVSEHIKLTQMG